MSRTQEPQTQEPEAKAHDELTEDEMDQVSAGIAMPNNLGARVRGGRFENVRGLIAPVDLQGIGRRKK